MRIGFIKKFADGMGSGPKVWLYRSIFFFCLLMPIVGLGFFDYVHTYQEMTKDLLAQRKALAYLAATTTQERLDALVNLGISLASRKGVIEGVEKGDWSEAASRLDTVIVEFPMVDRLILYDMNATIRGSMPPRLEIIGQSRTDKEWYPQVKKRWMPYISAVYKRGSDPKINVISVLIPVKAQGVVINSDSSSPQERQKVLGLLQIQFRLAFFSKWLANVDAGLGGFVFIVDQKGQIVYHPKFNSEQKTINFSVVPVVQDLLKGKSGVRVNYNPIEKVTRLAAFEPVKGYGV
jgi:hypothetical protein